MAGLVLPPAAAPPAAAPPGARKRSRILSSSEDEGGGGECGDGAGRSGARSRSVTPLLPVLAGGGGAEGVPPHGGDSAAEALDSVAQLTSLLQAKIAEAERLRSRLESLEQLAECCICLENPVSHAFRSCAPTLIKDKPMCARDACRQHSRVRRGLACFGGPQLPGRRADRRPRRLCRTGADVGSCGHLFCCKPACDSARVQVCPLCRSQVHTRTRLFGLVDAFERSGLGMGLAEPAEQSAAAVSQTPAAAPSHATDPVLAKVRGAFLHLQQQLQSGEQLTTQGQARLSEFHQSERCTQGRIGELEKSVGAVEAALSCVQRELALQKIGQAARKGDARLVAHVMQAWSTCGQVAQAGCRALKSCEWPGRHRESKRTHSI